MLAAFQPQGNTSLIAASTAASAAIQPSTGNIQGVRIANIGSVTSYVAISGSSSVSAAAPSTSAAANGIPLLPNAGETFTVPPNFWVSAVTTSGTANVFLTPGFGV